MTKKKGIAVLIILSILFFPILNATLLSQSKWMYQVLVRQADFMSLSSEEQNQIADKIHQGLLYGSSIQVELDDGSLAFQRHEIIHMKDVAHLLHLLRIILWVLVGLIMLTLLLSKPLSREQYQKTGKGAIIGLVGIALILLLFFPFFFHYFHVWSFPNDYWMLNPQTDLLIHLFPQLFFPLSLAWVFALSMLFSYLFWVLFPRILQWRLK